MEIRKKILWIILVFIIVFLFANKGFRALISRQKVVYDLKKEFKKLKEENALLQKKLYYLENETAYIEVYARKNLGLIKPGEKKYIFLNK